MVHLLEHAESPPSTRRVRGLVSRRSGAGVPFLSQEGPRSGHLLEQARGPQLCQEGQWSWTPVERERGPQQPVGGAGVPALAGVVAASHPSPRRGHCPFLRWSRRGIPYVCQVRLKSRPLLEWAQGLLPLQVGTGAPSALEREWGLLTPPGGSGVPYFLVDLRGPLPTPGRANVHSHSPPPTLEQARDPLPPTGRAGNTSPTGAGAGSTPFVMLVGGLVPGWGGCQVISLCQAGLCSHPPLD